MYSRSGEKLKSGTANGSKRIECLLFEDKLKKQNIDVVTIGNGKSVIKQYPPKGTTILSGNKAFLLTNSNKYIKKCQGP